VARRDSGRWTIDELARRSGVSSRNIRYYQTLGLLPRPRLEGGSGSYGRQHAERLALIQELQSEGLNLRGIGWLLGGADSVASEELRRLKGAVLEGWVREEPEEVSTGQLLDRLQLEEVDPGVVQRAIELELIEPTGQADRWRVPVPSILRAGGELRSMGVSVAEALEVLEVLRSHVTSVAEAFVELVDRNVVEPFDARGRPAEEWPQVRETIERLRPLAGEVLLAVLHHRMPQVVARWVGEDAPDT
jgi:DNA-binding transcriptional MerR regulator